MFRDELIKRWWVGDPFRPTEEALRYYEIKHQIVARLQPKSICEIGVRAGYSAYTFLSAVPAAAYCGIDIGTSGPMDINEAASCCTHALGILREFPGAFVLWRDSRELKQLPIHGNGRLPYEFVYVDADHSYAGCAHDLGLASQAARWILVDDFDVGPEVRAACRDFLLAHPEWVAEYIPDGFRGNLLLAGTRHQ